MVNLGPFQKVCSVFQDWKSALSGHLEWTARRLVEDTLRPGHKNQNIYEHICSEKQKVKVRRLWSIHLHILSFTEILHGVRERVKERLRLSLMGGLPAPLMGPGDTCPVDTEPFGVPRPSVLKELPQKIHLSSEMAAEIQKSTLNPDPGKTNLGIEMRRRNFSGSPDSELW